MSSPLMPTYAAAAGHVRPRRGHRAVGRRRASEYLDFLCGLAVTSLGHSHPAVADALDEQARTLLHVVEPVRHRAAARGRRTSTLDRLLGGRTGSGVLLQLRRRGQRVRASSWPASGAGAAATSWSARTARSTAARSPRCTPPGQPPKHEAVPAAARGLPPRGLGRPRRARGGARPVGRRRAARAGAGRGRREPRHRRVLPGRPPAVRRARASCSWSTRCRPASAAPGGGSASSTSASCPTS